MTNHRYLITFAHRGEVSTYSLVGTLQHALEAAQATADTGGTEVTVRRGYGDHRVEAVV